MSRIHDHYRYQLLMVSHRVSLFALLLLACESKVDPGVQPVDGPYSACTESQECGDLACTLGTCTVTCSFRNQQPDPSTCPDVPDEVHANLGCVPQAGDVGDWYAVCALLCGEDGACPEGMECVTEEFDFGPEGEMSYCR